MAQHHLPKVGIGVRFPLPAPMKLTLTKKHDEAKGTKSFFFEPAKPIRYLPGQYYYLTLPKLDQPDPRGATRHFTLSSSPTEGNLLRITTRIRPESGFKQTLASLPIGSTVAGEGPNGSFVLHDSDRGSHVFLAGGIGITPFRSMIKYNLDKGLKIPIYLIYSNSNPDEVTFASKLDSWVKANDFLKMESIVTSRDGRLDAPKMQKLIGDWGLEIGGCTFWLCGPPTMVSALEEIVSSLGVKPDKIRSEKFTGY